MRGDVHKSNTLFASLLLKVRSIATDEDLSMQYLFPKWVQ